MKKEKIEYKVYSFRLNKKTIKHLKLIKLEINKSWNLIIYELIKEYINNNKYNYYKYFRKDYLKYKKDYCEICKVKEEIKRNGYYNKSNLCVHHKDGNIINNNKNNLQTLCIKCHGKQYPR